MVFVLVRRSCKVVPEGLVENLCARSAHFFLDGLHPQLGTPRSIPVVDG